MAKIPQSTGSGLGALGEPPPAGTYLAVCVDVIDSYGVDRPKYQSEEMEKVDVTRFVFGVKTKKGDLHKIATREMKITGGPKANLTKFLKAWTGENPKPGMDTEELKGKGAQITVTAEESRNGKTYNNITGIAPVLEGYEANVPAVNAFANVGGSAAKSDDESEFEVLGPVKDGNDPF
jgi:hypothetical protein